MGEQEEDSAELLAKRAANVARGKAMDAKRQWHHRYNRAGGDAPDLLSGAAAEAARADTAADGAQEGDDEADGGIHTVVVGC